MATLSMRAHKVGEAPDPDELAPVIELGAPLIPLHRWDATTVDGKSKGKAPRDIDWPNRDYSGLDARAYMASGRNVGVRLDALLVVDADPRNYPEGRDPLSELSEALGVNLTDVAATVETGGGGWHLYFRAPVLGEGMRLRGSLPEYPGIEFKHGRGRQILAPGCKHPNGAIYRAVDPLDERPLADPPACFDALARVLTADAPFEAGSSPWWGSHYPEQIGRMLEALDVETYRGEGGPEGRWFKLMCAAHHGSAGEALPQFQAWCAGDPVYAGGEADVAHRWESLSADGRSGKPVTPRTLFQQLEEAGRSDAWEPPLRAADEDFDDPPPKPKDTGRRLAAGSLEGCLLDSAPDTVARELLRGTTLLRSNGDWLERETETGRYIEVPQEAMRARAWRFVEGLPYVRRPNPTRSDPDPTPQRAVMRAGKKAVDEVLEGASAWRQGPSSLPTWWPRRLEVDPSPDRLLALGNGLLDTETMEMMPPTRRFITRNASPVSYVRNAPDPDGWLRFLDEIFEGDQEQIDCLEEVIGLVLTQDVSFQKIFVLVGPRRSGKGTVLRTVQEMVGEGNHCSVSAKSMADDFGLQPLIGKQLAVMSDFRLHGRSPAAMVENLLRISGADEVTVNRKHRDAWQGRLSARFLMASNELMALHDASGAVVSRLIVMRTKASFYGQEDKTLFERVIRPELPGILNRCLRALVRLRARGHFLQPSSSAADIETMEAVASPVKAFARKWLRQEQGALTPKDEVYMAFNDFLAEEGLSYSPEKARFFRDLAAADIRFKEERPHINGERVRCLRGVRLIED